MFVLVRRNKFYRNQKLICSKQRKATERIGRYFLNEFYKKIRLVEKKPQISVDKLIFLSIIYSERL